MGDVDIVLKDYFKDTTRFADLFNGVFFGGITVIKPDDLIDVSESYYTKGKKNKELSREIKMRAGNGVKFRLLALENQNQIDYSMPFRCMEYDTLEYKKQVQAIRNRNVRSDKREKKNNWINLFKKTDRLMPVYTLCVYYGTDIWDGPRCLKDMMDFGEDDEMGSFFIDYPMRLFCINEQKDFSDFSKDVAVIFEVARNRTRPDVLRERLSAGKMWEMGCEAFEVASALLGSDKLWKDRERFMSNVEMEEYDMCEALRILMQEEREDGREEGREEGKLKVLCELLINKIITLEEAVGQSGMTKEMFLDKTKSFFNS